MGRLPSARAQEIVDWPLDAGGLLDIWEPRALPVQALTIQTSREW